MRFSLRLLPHFSPRALPRFSAGLAGAAFVLFGVAAFPGGLSPAAADAGSSIAAARALCDAHRGRPDAQAAMTLERGELALLTRGWLVEHAERRIDVQTFIWSADNVGRLAMDAFLRAADRGVQVRILVDDFLLETPTEWMSALDRHPGIEIRVYNPTVRTGVSFWRRYWNALTGFRAVNQRMHNKILIVDSSVAVTGGRNLADEYFDFNHAYNFRDRDVLVMGEVVAPMQRTFERYWRSSLAKPYGERVARPTAARLDSAERAIRAYAADTLHFKPAIRAAMLNLHQGFDTVFKHWVWAPMRFVTDSPGKNSGEHGLGGGGITTRFLGGLIDSAKTSITLQSPYLVPNDPALALFARKVAQGVPVRISTNSLANNDNVQAMGGYLRRRNRILKAGIDVFELKPHPGHEARIVERLPDFKGVSPSLVLHAKTAVIDHRRVFISTFNLDPRSMNLNTESGLLIDDAGLAREVETAIENDMRPENSWEARRENGDREVSLGVRLKTWFWGFLPIEPLI